MSIDGFDWPSSDAFGDPFAVDANGLDIPSTPDVAQQLNEPSSDGNDVDAGHELRLASEKDATDIMSDSITASPVDSSQQNADKRASLEIFEPIEVDTLVDEPAIAPREVAITAPTDHPLSQSEECVAASPKAGAVTEIAWEISLEHAPVKPSPRDAAPSLESGADNIKENEAHDEDENSSDSSSAETVIKASALPKIAPQEPVKVTDIDAEYDNAAVQVVAAQGLRNQAAESKETDIDDVPIEEGHNAAERMDSVIHVVPVQAPSMETDIDEVTQAPDNAITPDDASADVGQTSVLEAGVSVQQEPCTEPSHDSLPSAELDVDDLGVNISKTAVTIEKNMEALSVGSDADEAPSAITTPDSDPIQPLLSLSDKPAASSKQATLSINTPSLEQEMIAETPPRPSSMHASTRPVVERIPLKVEMFEVVDGHYRGSFLSKSTVVVRGRIVWSVPDDASALQREPDVQLLV